MAKSDVSVSQTHLESLEKFLNRIESSHRKSLITSEVARTRLGEAEGRSVSRPYLKSLVNKGVLHPIKLSARKTRFDSEEIADFLACGKEVM